MFDAQWWEDRELRILVLGSLCLQWFLLVATPMRSYIIWPIFRASIGLAFVSSNALAIYALGVLFNRHLKAIATGSMQESTLELLWAPILLIHLAGKEEMAAHRVVEDNKQWIGDTVTFASKVAVAMYVFYKSWPSSSDWRLLAATILLFVIGIASFSEKPWAHWRAKIDRLDAISAVIRGTKSMRSTSMENLNKFLFLVKEGKFFTQMPSSTEGRGSQSKVLSDEDKLLMVLSDISLLVAKEELVARNRIRDAEDVLTRLELTEGPLPRQLPHWMLTAFELIYTRASLVSYPVYLVYHMVVIPVIHIATITLFATSDKHPYKLADVKVTYILLCLTAVLDVVAVLSRQLVYRLMSMVGVPALCETIPGYNIIDTALLERYKGIGFIYKGSMGFSCKEYFVCVPEERSKVYKNVLGSVLMDMVGDARGRDIASYRIFMDHSTADKEIPTSSIADNNSNWALSKELQKHCGQEIKKSLGGVSFDRSVLLWHIATDLCFRCIDEGGGAETSLFLGHYRECTGAISNYMAHLLKFNPEMLLTGSREHLISEAMKEIRSCFLLEKEKLMQRDQLKELISGIADGTMKKVEQKPGKVHDDTTTFFHIIEACKLARELLGIPEHTRWELMYRVWLGMMCYSASMCRGYLHAKSLGEGGEFLTFVWLVLSLKGLQTLAAKLQMPPDNRSLQTSARQSSPSDLST